MEKKDLTSRIEKMQKESALRANQDAALPSWPEIKRGVPNGFLRSALFGIVKQSRDIYLTKARLDALEGIELIYSGPRLDQVDLDVWEAVLHAARKQKLGGICNITAYQLLQIMGKIDNGFNRKMVDVRLERLGTTMVNIKIGTRSYSGSLIDEVYREEKTKEYCIVLNTKLSRLFGKDGWTALDWNVRHDLMGSPLALWVHGFYSTHTKPFPIKVATLHRLSGSEHKEVRFFKRDLKIAMQHVEDACKFHGTEFNWSITDDLVTVSWGSTALSNTEVQRTL